MGRDTEGDAIECYCACAYRVCEARRYMSFCFRAVLSIPCSRSVSRAGIVSHGAHARAKRDREESERTREVWERERGCTKEREGGGERDRERERERDRGRGTEGDRERGR